MTNKSLFLQAGSHSKLRNFTVLLARTICIMDWNTCN